MATYSSILAWRIPWTEEAGGLQPIGSQRVGHDESDWAAAVAFLFYQALDGLDDTLLHWWGQTFLLSLLTQMLTASRNTLTNTPWSNVLPGHTPLNWHIKLTIIHWKWSIVLFCKEPRYNFTLPLKKVANNKSHCFCCSVAKWCTTLWDPMDCGTPRSPVLHYFPEFAQTHVHWVGDAIQPSHPLWSPSPPALNLSQSLFQWVISLFQCVCIRWPKYWSFSFSISPSNEYSFGKANINLSAIPMTNNKTIFSSRVHLFPFFCGQFSELWKLISWVQSGHHVVNFSTLGFQCL